MKLHRTQSHRDPPGTARADTSGAVVCQVACQRQLANCMDHIDGQMAHIMADSSVSHVRLRKKVERGVVTGHDPHVFCIRSANAGSDCSTRFYLRVAMRPAVFRQEHLETRQQPLQEPSMHGFQGSLVGRVFSMRCCVDRARRRHRTFANTMVSCNTGTGDLCIHL